MANNISFSQWLSHYDNISDNAVAYMKEHYENDQMSFSEWEARMDEACIAHPEWAEDN